MEKTRTRAASPVGHLLRQWRDRRHLSQLALAIDVLEMASHLDHVVLFSGDGDFRRLVEAVQRKGVRVSVIVYAQNGAPASGARADLYPAKGERTNDPANAGKAIENLFSGAGASGPDGKIELGRYMPGEYRLEAQRGFSKATDPEVTIAAGRDEVELKIDLP